MVNTTNPPADDDCDIPMSVVRFCARECERQNTGPIAVANMIDAWIFAVSLQDQDSISVTDIAKLGLLVEPEINKNGLRTIPAIFRNGNIALAPNLIQHQLGLLCDHVYILTPTEFYQSFESIHPFVDGNGRVGALLYNVLRDSILRPITPPEFKA